MESSQLWNLVFGALISLNIGALLYGLKLFVELYGRVAALESLPKDVDRVEKMIHALSESIKDVMRELVELRS